MVDMTYGNVGAFQGGGGGDGCGGGGETAKEPRNEDPSTFGLDNWLFVCKHKILIKQIKEF